uniref:Phosphorylated adapter RNA export protein n=1 Tax=Kalanchoe fedtschenkoi TaxID=63787 RepID=A0A7N0RH89_KALFE
MDGEESLLDSIYEDDVEMVDVEEGEFVEDGILNEIGPSGDGGVDIVFEGSVNGKSKESCCGSGKKKKNRRRKKKSKSASVPKFTDVDRFVLETCRRLKEKKSYMVYNAVGCLGVAALSDVLKEVDAIQACGGQMTADGRRHRTGGGILWSILKAREPTAYSEIMKKSRDFEKQFKPQSFRQPFKGNGMASHGITQSQVSHSSGTELDDAQHIPQITGHLEQSGLEGLPEPSKLEIVGKQKSVHDRIRVPVRYDDLFEEDPKLSSS